MSKLEKRYVREPFGLELQGVRQVDLSVLVLRRIPQGLFEVLDGALVAVGDCVPAGKERRNSTDVDRDREDISRGQYLRQRQIHEFNNAHDSACYERVRVLRVDVERTRVHRHRVRVTTRAVQRHSLFNAIFTQNKR